MEIHVLNKLNSYCHCLKQKESRNVWHFHHSKEIKGDWLSVIPSILVFQSSSVQSQPFPGPPCPTPKISTRLPVTHLLESSHSLCALFFALFSSFIHSFFCSSSKCIASTSKYVPVSILCGLCRVAVERVIVQMTKQTQC